MFVVPMSRVTRHASPDLRHLSRLLDDGFDRLLGVTADTDSTAVRSPALDIAETDSAYSVSLEMPGVSKDDVKVSVEGRKVTVQASAPLGTPTSPQASPQDGETKQSSERVVYRERAATRYARTITLPAEVDQAEAGAKLEHGVLTLTLPKRSVRSAAQISVN